MDRKRFVHVDLVKTENLLTRRERKGDIHAYLTQKWR